MLSTEQIARLTPEELVIAQKWELERETRLALVDAVQAAEKAGDLATADSILHQILDSCPNRCEHDRDIASPCLSCHILEKKLYPELFQDED